MARCGARIRTLAETLKGADAQAISPCETVIVVNAVREPKVLDVKNCRGHLDVTNVGQTWLSNILKQNRISKSQIEYVSFAPLSGSLGCYRVSVTFDEKPGAKDSSFGGKKGTFCVSGVHRRRENGVKSNLSDPKTIM